MYTNKHRSFREIESLCEPLGPTKSTAQRWVASHLFGKALLQAEQKEERRGRKTIFQNADFRSKVDQIINDKPFHSATRFKKTLEGSGWF